ncbi:MAG: choice-of-anchor J domain-containing protein [Bacteroidales bacterium]|nr:choice-of-anchor J domain-containing protein [Bacteroidales bacterium]
MKAKKIMLILFVLIYSQFLTAQTTLLDEGFEGSFPPTGWVILNLGSQTSGETWMQSATHHHTGSYSAFSQDGQAGDNMEEWLITNSISVPANSYIELTFWHKFQWASYSDGPEYVLISTSTPTPAAFTDTVFCEPGIGPTGWTEIILNNLPDYAGQTIYIAFVHTSANGYADAWILDDILIESFETGGTDIGMLSIEVPEDYVFINTDVFPSGVIKNQGTEEITDYFSINCEIVNESLVTVYTSSYMYIQAISSGQVDTITFYDAWTPTQGGDYTVIMSTSLTGDINPANDTITGETEVVQHYGTGGPDAFGYRWIDSEEPGGPVFNWIEISGTGTSAITYGGVPFYGDDNFSDTISFGFNFPFYGIDRTFCYIDVNGEMLLAHNTWYNAYPLIGWNYDGNMFNYVYPIPGYTQMPALISPYWDDLIADEGVGDVYFQTFGTEPNRYFVVEWHNLRFRYGTVEDTTLRFEVILHESGEIIFQYKTTAIGQTGSVCPHDNGRSSTVAIQNDDADIGLCYLREIVETGSYIGVEPLGNLLQDKLAIRFYMGEDNQPPAFLYEGKGSTFDNTPEIPVKIVDMSGLLSDSLYYNTGSGWEAVTHYNFIEPNMYYYQLPQIPNSTIVHYYFAATDNSDSLNRGTYPVNAPDSCFSFKILPTEGVDVLFAHPGGQDNQNLEFPKFIMALDAAGVIYDIYDWSEYEEYTFPQEYKAIFTYANSAGGSSKHDTLSIALMDFMDSGTNENPKNVFMASDNFAFAQHGYSNAKPMVKFYTAYMRGGYHPQGNPLEPPWGGTNGLGGPSCWDYSNGTVKAATGSPIGVIGVELPVYANSPDVLYNRDCPSWYASQVTNPGISSYDSFIFEDGPMANGQAYAYNYACAVWLDNLIYKSFYTSFDISQFTNDDDIKMIIADALEWFGIDVSFKIDLKAFLNGPFNGTDMNTYLNSSTYLPLSQPYNISPWNYLGTESVIAMPNANVVDWVLVELRDTTDAASATGSTIAAQQAAFVLNDGTITGMDGSSELIFNITIDENLFAVIWHRNHLGVLSANPLVETGGVYTYDFSTGEGQAYGGANGHKEIATGVWGMFGGDGNADKQISNSDKVDIWETQAGGSGYLSGDFSLDGQCNNTDKVEIWAPNTGRSSQVPE